MNQMKCNEIRMKTRDFFFWVTAMQSKATTTTTKKSTDKSNTCPDSQIFHTNLIIVYLWQIFFYRHSKVPNKSFFSKWIHTHTHTHTHTLLSLLSHKIFILTHFKHTYTHTNSEKKTIKPCGSSNFMKNYLASLTVYYYSR